MKPSLASWGALILLGPAAAMSTAAAAFAAKSDVGFLWGGYAKNIVSSCYEDYQVATAERIFTTLLRPLLYETCLVKKNSLGNRPTPSAAGVYSKQYTGRVRRLCAQIKPSLESWGVSLGLLTTVDCVAKPCGGLFWDGYARMIVASCYEDHEVATAERIFTTLLRPLLYETCLEDPTDDDVVRVLRGGGSDANTTHVTKASEDILRIVCEMRGGGVDYRQPTRITNTSFVVTGEQARDAKKSTVEQCPRGKALTGGFHVQPQIEHDADDSSSSSSSSNSITTTATAAANTAAANTIISSTSTSGIQDSGDKHVNISPSTIINTRGGASTITNSANFIGRRGTSTSDTRNSENTHVYRGVEAALKASDERSLTPDVRLLSHRKVDMLNTIATKSHSQTPAVSKATRISSHNRVAKPVVVGVFWHPINTRSSRNIAESRSNLRRDSASNHLVIKSHSALCPINPWVRKRTCSLQVGDASVGTLRSAEKRSKLWTEETDNPPRFQKRSALLSTNDAGGRGTQPGLVQSTTLLGSDREASHKVDITLGKTLKGTVRFAEGGVAVWPRVDGSSRFGKHPAQPSLVDDGEKETGKTPMMMFSEPPPGSESAPARKGVSSPKPVLEGEYGNNNNLPSSESEIAQHVLTTKKTTLSIDDFETSLLAPGANIAQKRSSKCKIGLQDSRGEGDGAGSRALQSKYTLSSDRELSPAVVPGTQKMEFRGTGQGGEKAVSRAKLPIDLIGADPETVQELMITRKIVLQGISAEGETREPDETQSINLKASDSDKGREVLTAPTPVVQAESGTTNLNSYPEKVREVLSMPREILQEEDGTIFRSDPQKMPEVLSIQDTVHNEEGVKDSDFVGDRKKKVRGWLPWGKHPEEGRLNHLFAATTDMEGPMCVSEAKRGCVLETVDGATVVSQSGHFTWDWVSRFPWKRPEDHSHREILTEEKWEARVGGRKVYGLSGKDWMG